MSIELDDYMVTHAGIICKWRIFPNNGRLNSSLTTNQIAYEDYSKTHN